MELEKNHEEAYLEKVDQLSVCRAHLVWIHDLVPPPQLEQLLEEQLVPFEVPILEQVLALLIVRSKNETGQDRTELPDLLNDPLRLRQTKSYGVNPIRLSHR